MKKIRKMKKFGEPPAHFSPQPKMKRKGKKKGNSPKIKIQPQARVWHVLVHSPLFLPLSLLSWLGKPETPKNTPTIISSSSFSLSLRNLHQPALQPPSSTRRFSPTSSSYGSPQAASTKSHSTPASLQHLHCPHRGRD